MKNTALISRLIRYIEANGIKKGFVAAKLGLTNSQLSHILTGFRAPSDRIIKRIEKYLNSTKRSRTELARDIQSRTGGAVKVEDLIR